MIESSSKAESSDITVRERLLEGATRLFTRKGYNGTTVREIVASARVTKPVLYYYFQNKEGIYLELIQGAFKIFDALLDASRKERGSPMERLLCLSDRIFSLFMENIEVAKLMYSIYYGPPQGAPFFDFDAYHLKFHDTIKRLVKEGIHRGDFQKGNAKDMMWAILGAINVAMEVQLSHPERAIDRKGLARILKLILRGFQKEGKRK